MPLNEKYQLSILQDILKNHQLDCCGTVAEYQQLERLIQSLLSNYQVNEEMKSTLLDVYNYSQHGQNTRDLDQHIHAHKDALATWVDHIDNFHF